MPQEYTITKVSEQPPRTYYNEQYKSTTYYIKVMLEGHAKPVEIGKKAPDSLRVGDKVYGTITETTYPSDNFKAAKQGFGGQADLTPVLSKLDAIHGDLKLFMSWYRSDKKGEFETTNPVTPEKDIVDENVEDEINLDDIPF